MQFLPSLAIFAAVNLVWLAISGVHLGGDTGLFLDGARRLLDGQPLVDREPSYLGYVAVIAASQAVGAGLLGVVLIQIAVATAGAGAVYRLGMELGGTRVAAGTVAGVRPVTGRGRPDRRRPRSKAAGRR